MSLNCRYIYLQIKSMKKILFAIAIASISLNAMGQTVTTTSKQKTTTSVTKTKAAADARAIPYSKELKAKLGLNDDQYNKVLAVNTECINKKDQKVNSKEISAYRQQQYQTILTPDQMAKLKAINAQGGKKAATTATPAKTTN